MRKLLIILAILSVAVLCFAGEDIRDEIPPIAVKHYINGMQAEIEGNLDRALSSYLIALNFVPDDPELLRTVADLYMQMGQPDRAFEEYYILIDLYPENEYYRVAAAEAAFTMRSYDEAERQLEWLVKNTPPNFEIHIQYALTLVNLNETKDALKALKKTAKLFPDQPGPFGLMGNIHLGRGEYRDAVEAFQKSVEIMPTYVRGYLGMAAAYEALGIQDSVMIAQEMYVSLNPGNPEVNKRWISTLIAEGEYDRAVEAADDYLCTVPDDWELLRNIAFMAYYGEYYIRSTEYLSRILEWDATDREARLFYGRSLLHLDSVGRGIEEIETAIAQERDVDGLITLALAYEAADSLEIAMDVLRQGEAEFAEDSSIPLYQGILHARAGDYDSAKLAFQTSLQIEPYNIEALFGLGNALERTGHRPKAIEIFRELRRENPEDPLVANYLGYLLVEDNRELALADSLVSFALDLEPDNAAYLDSYGWLLYRKGEHAEALDFLLRAENLASHPDPVIFEHIGEVYEKLGKTELASTYYLKALELNPEMEHSKERLEELK